MHFGSGFNVVVGIAIFNGGVDNRKAVDEGSVCFVELPEEIR